MVEIIILAAVAGFLFLRLRDVLGRKTGHENPSDYFGQKGGAADARGGDSETVIQFPGSDGPPPLNNDDVAGLVGLESDAGRALIAAKEFEPGFDARRFVEGARTAYEMILMSFETGDKATLRPLLAPDVYDSFAAAIDDRREKGYSVDARFVGLRSSDIDAARLDEESRALEVTVRFDAETIVAVRNAAGEIVEGDPEAVRRMRDIWTFRRIMGSDDPSWLLVETDA